jgi:hypothetical protein
MQRTNMLDTWLEEKLRERKAKSLLRSLPKPNNLIDFTSNDYLGLARYIKTSLTPLRRSLSMVPQARACYPAIRS